MDLANMFKALFTDQMIIESATEMFRDRPLELKLLDPEDFVKKNDVQEVTNHITFIRDGIPTPDGLLSNEIFGITKDERAGLYGYIDLKSWFMHPLCYKVWGSMDKNIKNIVHSIDTYSIDTNGNLIQDPKGGTGIDWLMKNIESIKIRSTESRKRDIKINFLEQNKDRLFMRKLIVIPPFYRDVANNGGKVELGSINKYYQSIIRTAISIKDRQDMFGGDAGDADKGRMQEMLVAIYKALSGTSTDADDGVGLGKDGIIDTAGKSKTTDNGTRLVLSAPELKAETVDQLMVNMQYSALPLASAIVNFKPLIIFNIKRFFDNEFGGSTNMQSIGKDGKVRYVKVVEPQMQFSDTIIEKQMKKFVHGFSNRFEPVMVNVEGPNNKPIQMSMVFKGRSVSAKDYAAGNTGGNSSLIDRPLTWCDILYMAAVEAVNGKHILITRYPIDSIYNQFPTKINISTIKDMEPVYVDGKYYEHYPRIRAEDVGSNTSNRFIDTLNICNLYLKGINGDYDGDTAGIKGCWLVETNEELDMFTISKIHYINFGGNNIRVSSNEALQSIYSLTKTLATDEKLLTDPIF